MRALIPNGDAMHLKTFVLTFCLSIVGSAFADDAEENHYAQFYGFSGIELFELDNRAFNLTTGDFDSDGLTDLLAVDNRASCLQFFRQRKDPEAARKKSGRYVNDLRSDWRFDNRQIIVDKQVAGLISGDFNGDDRTDVAYVGAPDRLIVRFQPETGRTEWSDKWTVRLPELAPASWMISAGDLNNDQKTDIAVIGKNVTYIVYQGDDGMETPVPLINTSSQLSLLSIADLNGDSRMDLCYQATAGSSRGLCARLQTADGRLGPEVQFDLQSPRSLTLADIDQQPGAEILTVDSRTGRVHVSRVEESTLKDNELPSRLVQYGIGEIAGNETRAIAIGDIDGDKLIDVAITDPQKAQVLVYRQNGIDGLGTVETFPGLLGATQIEMVDVDNDGIMEVIVMSEKEASVAVSRFTDGRLSFPRKKMSASESHELITMLTVRDGDRTLLAVVEKRERSSDGNQIRFMELKGDEWRAIGEAAKLPKESIGSRGAKLTAMTGKTPDRSLILMVPEGSKSKGIYTITPPTADSELIIKGPTNLGISKAGALHVSGDSLYVARDAFARQMQLKENEWEVADQFNAGESKARIEGVAVVDLNRDQTDEVVLIDSGIKKLRVLKKSGELFKPWKEVDLGALKFEQVITGDFDGDGQQDLLLFSQEFFGVLYSRRSDLKLTEVATYESERDDAYAADVVAGDLNSDGIVDLAVIDTSIDGVDLLYFDGKSQLEPATHFRVFEEKRLVSESNSRGTQPREGKIVDLTNDGLADLILICHDRLILYPQDSANGQE